MSGKMTDEELRAVAIVGRLNDGIRFIEKIDGVEIYDIGGAHDLMAEAAIYLTSLAAEVLDLRARVAELEAALRTVNLAYDELTATVRGECSSLLHESDVLSGYMWDADAARRALEGKQ